MKNDFSVVFIACGLDFLSPSLPSHSYLPDEKRSHKNFLVAFSLEITGNLQIVDIFSSLPIQTKDAGKILSSLAAHS